MSYTTELRVPPELAFASLVDAFVTDAASRCELTGEQRDDAAAAARIGFAAIVEEALAESREPLRIVAVCTPVHLALSFFERGLPMDDGLARRDPRWERLAGLADEAHWHLHGTGGSELRLFLKRPRAPNLARPCADEALAEMPLAPPQQYTIRPFLPSDAAGVARAFYLTYGYAYDMPAVYAPARLVELNESGRYSSIVAIDDEGEVVGHYALARENGESQIADACGAIVVPPHRGRNLLNRLRERAEDEAITLGLAAYYSEPVTDHPRSQSASESFGAIACGITLGEAPRGFLARHMKLAATAQRQSCMLYVKVLRRRESRTIHPPRRHRAIVCRIYDELGLPVTIGNEKTPTGHGRFRTTIARADAIATIDVDAVGAETAALVCQAADDLRASHRLGAIYAALPLGDPGAPVVAEALQSYGFFFSGVGPLMLDGNDALRMQLLLSPVDPTELVVVGEFGKVLLEYIRSDETRTPNYFYAQ